MCRWVCGCCLAVAGVSKAQGADQTSHHQQRASIRERDPTGQTTGLQQRFTVLPQSTFVGFCFRVSMNYCVYAGGKMHTI